MNAEYAIIFDKVEQLCECYENQRCQLDRLERCINEIINLVDDDKKTQLRIALSNIDILSKRLKMLKDYSEDIADRSANMSKNLNRRIQDNIDYMMKTKLE